MIQHKLWNYLHRHVDTLEQLANWEKKAENKLRNECWSKWKAYTSTNPPPEEGLFEWGVDAHNDVNLRLNKPVVSHLEARELHRPQIIKPNCDYFFDVTDAEYLSAYKLPNKIVIPGLHNFVTALSLLPKHLERQTLCLSSWKRFGASIYAVNTQEEIKRLQPLYPQVDNWIIKNPVSTDYTYPTQLIRNLARMSIYLEDKIYLINSDIEVHGPQALIPETEAQLLGIRWNYNTGEELYQATQFQWGIDMVSFTPEQAALLPPDFPYAIGQSMWDYALPYYTLKGGHELQFLHKRLLYHEEHNTNWDQSSWEFGSKWISDRTELSIRSSLPSALWRESLDNKNHYQTNKGQWLDKYNERPTEDTINYEQWSKYVHPRGRYKR